MTVYNNIKRYLEGEMTEEELNYFEQEIANNDELKAQLQTYLLAQSAAKSIKIDEFAVYENNINTKKKNQKRLLFSILIIMLLGTGYWVYQSYFSESEFEEIYATHLKDVISSDFIMDNGTINRKVASAIKEDYNALLQAAMVNYDEKHYEIAVKQFDEILVDNPLILEVKLYRGITHYELGNYKKALTDLIFVDNGTSFSNAVDLKETAIWYKAFTNLKLNQKESAIQDFKRLEVSEKYGTETKQILNKLNNSK